MAFLKRLFSFSLLAVLGACTDLRSGTDTLTVDADSGQGPDGGSDASVSCIGPEIEKVDYPVIAHGGTLHIIGGCFDGATDVTIGGVSHAITSTTTSDVTVTLSSSVPVGTREVVVTTPAGSSSALAVTVIHLTIDEVDSVTAPNFRMQFIELGTGLSASTDLAGYVVVLIDGSGPTTYPPGRTPVIASTFTTSDGLYVLGGPLVTTKQGSFPMNTLGRGAGADAVLVMQTRTSVAANLALASVPGVLIDALVFSRADSADDTVLLTYAYGNSGTHTQWSEGGDTTNSVRRCGATLRTGSVFGLTTLGATLNAANVCP